MSLEADPIYDAKLQRRHKLSALFALGCRVCTWSAIAILLVLLASVAANVNRTGTLSVFLYQDADESVLTEIQTLLAAEPHVTSVSRDIDPDGNVSFDLEVENLKTQPTRIAWADQIVEGMQSDLAALHLDPPAKITITSNDKGQLVAVPDRELTDEELKQVGGTLQANQNTWDMSAGTVGEDQPAFFMDTNVRHRDIETSVAAKLDKYSQYNIETDSTEPVLGWDWGFLWRSNSTQKPENAGVRTGIWGSVWLVLLTAAIAVPIGVGAAVYLEEYSSDTLVTRIIKLNLANLAGVPSIVYGILGFAVFGRFFRLNSSVLAGSLTLALLILPVIIVATQEALKAIPGSIRTASIALGASKWQTIRHQVLPASLPGIATGVILALSRALGETAPIVVIGVLALTDSSPGGIESPMDIVTNPRGVASVPFDEFQALPVLIYEWVKDFRPEFAAQAARGILVLLVVLLLINSVAILIRNRYQKKLTW